MDPSAGQGWQPSRQLQRLLRGPAASVKAAMVDELLLSFDDEEFGQLPGQGCGLVMDEPFLICDSLDYDLYLPFLVW